MVLVGKGQHFELEHGLPELKRTQICIQLHVQNSSKNGTFHCFLNNIFHKFSRTSLPCALAPSAMPKNRAARRKETPPARASRPRCAARRLAAPEDGGVEAPAPRRHRGLPPEVRPRPREEPRRSTLRRTKEAAPGRGGARGPSRHTASKAHHPTTTLPYGSRL